MPVAALAALAADQEMRAALAHIEQEIVVSAERGDPVKGFVNQALADGPDKHIARKISAGTAE